MRSLRGVVVAILVVAVIVVVGLVANAAKSNRREIGTLTVQFNGPLGVSLRIAKRGSAIAEAIGVRDTTSLARPPVSVWGFPKAGQEAWLYHFASLGRSGSPCHLRIAVAGLPLRIGRELIVKIMSEGDTAPDPPVAVAIFLCPDLAARLATSGEKRKDHVLLILDGELTITGRDGDTLVGTLTAPLVISSYLSL